MTLHVLIILGGVALIIFVQYYYPNAAPVSSPAFGPRTGIATIGLAMVILGYALFSKDKSGLEPEQRLFVRTYEAMSKLKEYVMDSSKTKARKLAKKRLQSLSNRVETEWSLNFKLAKETLSPVEAFVTNLTDRVLYSVEKGKHEHVSNALAFVEQFAWFLLKDHTTIQDLSTIGASAVLLERPPKKKSLLGKSLTWIRTQPSSRGIVAFTVLGAIAAILTFETARIVGVDVNYAWASAVAVFLAFFGYNWKKKA